MSSVRQIVAPALTPSGTPLHIELRALRRIAVERADEAIRDVLRAQYDNVPALVVPSPPGAGKTDLVEKLAVQESALRHQRCVVVTQTNQQAFELVLRLRQHYAGVPVTLYCRDRLVLPETLIRGPFLQVIHEPGQLPAGPCLVVANAMKLANSAVPLGAFDLLIGDEAWQMPNYVFLLIAGLAARVLLVGDPGQIAPVIAADTRRWRDDPTGPHVPAPAALLAAHPTTPVIGLPISRRLVDDSAAVVQRAFYPSLPFEALDPASDRRVEFRTLAAAQPIDEVLAGVAAGQTISMLELPAAAPVMTDSEIANTITRLVERFVVRGAHVVGPQGATRVEATRIGVVCAHRSQVRAVRASLAPALAPHVLVETANRFQGLERDLIVAWHPLTGRPTAREFHVDSGRFCVMLSRHRAACVVVAREGVAEVLDRYTPGEPPVLGADGDAEFDGWFAHRQVLEHLVNSGRVLQSGRSARR